MWRRCPRWLYAPVYVALGGVAVITLIAAGGVLYNLGAVVHGIKRPNPSPRWFGFHEVFHAFTVLAFATYYVAASLAIYSLYPRPTEGSGRG